MTTENLRALNAGHAYGAFLSRIEVTERTWNDAYATAKQSINPADVLNELFEDYEGALRDAGDDAVAIGRIYLVAREALADRQACQALGIRREKQ